MKSLRRILAVFLLAALCAGILALPATAASTYMEHEGLNITVQMDKEQYGDDEPITATIIVENTSFETVTITNLEQLIPEGYQLAGGSDDSMQNIELMPSEIVILEVTFEKDPYVAESASTEDFFDKILYGETLGISNLLLVVIAAIAFAVFMLLT